VFINEEGEDRGRFSVFVYDFLRFYLFSKRRQSRQGTVLCLHVYFFTFLFVFEKKTEKTGDGSLSSCVIFYVFICFRKEDRADRGRFSVFMCIFLRFYLFSKRRADRGRFSVFMCIFYVFICFRKEDREPSPVFLCHFSHFSTIPLLIPAIRDICLTDAPLAKTSVTNSCF